MRPNLNPLTDRRRRGSGHRRPGFPGRPRSGEPTTETHALPPAPRAPAAPAGPGAPEGEPERKVDLQADPDLKRGREAGGPDDQASYTCQCGFVFAAEVSTTVACPNCGGSQAW